MDRQFQLFQFQPLAPVSNYVENTYDEVQIEYEEGLF